MSYPELFTKGHIGSLDLPNRLVFPPFQSRAADEHGFATERLTDFLVERARKGPGLIIVQHSFCWGGSGVDHGLDISSDACIAPLARLVKAVKATGARVAIQIGGRTLRQGGAQALAPSAIPISFEPQMPRAITKEEIAGFIGAYAAAARRIREAGFDAVELHGLSGKLIAQFLSPYFNRRTDEYGGSMENRVRFPREIMEAIHAEAGADFPIIFGLTMDEGLEGGVTPDLAVQQAVLLSKAGAAAFYVSLGTQEKSWYAGASWIYTSPTRLHLGGPVKRATGLPVIVDGKVASLEQAESLIRDGHADFIGICRPLIADPDFVVKSLEKRMADIRRCLYCSNCTTWPRRPYLREFGAGCTVNAATFRERTFVPVPTEHPRDILIIGGGLAGMEAARVLAERGHHVTLHEAGDTLGGQWLVASHGEGKQELRTIVPWLVRQMKKWGVDIRLNSRITPQKLDEIKPSCVILATGAVPRKWRGERPLTGGPDLVQGNDVIMGRVTVGKRVLVVGARYIGMDIAWRLAVSGHHVSLIDVNGIGDGTITSFGEIYREKLVETGVYMYPFSPLMRITSYGADISNNHSMVSLNVDTVVFAIGTIPENSLEEYLKDKNIEHYLCGDCAGIGDALKAIRDGAEMGMKL